MKECACSTEACTHDDNQSCSVGRMTVCRAAPDAALIWVAENMLSVFSGQYLPAAYFEITLIAGSW
jgi:hypothetical protein